ncbi:mannose-1-phosphate guanylyltransferase/mannose-6-phosphate isomerase [Methanoplanus sp. FWC-SCC4]|uniref:mannose-1-phosphate guanylyltransferase n=1 Tax=Methanochimaera problematica TaxID=2609417 RepID=A0AA97FFE8_9EURY|nr:mannose-1-phosphate guanylyltransferase/mannose-6-phosphate isomerase [Methanoplanus sp. FWC-SCC4]WOF16446.1 mannose-1-phosphate guanylyltransferase/mannose-6-phosphate isomerase [Methanoplanus sp. FWC-SCC4]
MKVIILAGGVGTRLWPLSRESYPKQFLYMNSHSLFQKTWLRSLKFSNPEDIYVVTGENYRFIVENQIEELGYNIPEEHVLKETVGKNTLPAILWGVKTICAESGDSDILVFPSDHILDDGAVDVINSAVPLSKENIVVFGINPSEANTGYGYIKPGKELSPGYLVDEFKEKPDLPLAKKYVEDGYLWNSGIFLFSSEVFLKETGKYQPELYEAFSNGDPDYNSLKSVSIDYGLLEFSERVAVMPLDVLWSDLGSFRSIYNIKEHDKNGNCGPADFIESKRNFVHAKDKKVALIGVDNLAVIDSGDALLVCNLDNSESVKDLVKMYLDRDDDVARYHLTVNRPWGSYTVLETQPFFKIKRVSVKKGHVLSLQLHHHRSEHWVVVSGSAEVTLNGETKIVTRGQSTFVPAGVSHRLFNNGKIPLEVIEVQIGEYLGEDDIVRFEDVYGRV